MTQRSLEVLRQELEGELLNALQDALRSRRLALEHRLLGASPATGDDALKLWSVLEGARRELLEFEANPRQYLGITTSRPGGR